jgi:hypothetical protein
LPARIVAQRDVKSKRTAVDFCWKNLTTVQVFEVEEFKTSDADDVLDALLRVFGPNLWMKVRRAEG